MVFSSVAYAESRICAVATAGMDGMGPSMTGYVYDAAGNRVAKGPITKMSCDPTQNGFETSGEESDLKLSHKTRESQNRHG